MEITPTQVGLAGALAVVLASAWYVDGRGRWYAALDERLLYGVPWGTLLAASAVVGFYLVVQGGFERPSDPLVLPFVTWSYFYPTGLLTAGIAHAGLAHLVSNVTATLVFGSIAEYAWGHRPRRERRARRRGLPTGGETAATDARRGGLLGRPWFRAFVAFPAALFAAALVTAVFSLGPGLGFSGVVFALVGFAAVLRPLAAVVGVVASSVLSVTLDALTQPVVRETVEAGGPSPPGWAGIAFQAHLLGFLLGVVVAVLVVSRRRRRPSFAALGLGVFAVGAVQSLWLLVWTPSQDVYVLYRGIGLAMVAGLALAIASAVAGRDRRLLTPGGRFAWLPSGRTVAVAWLALLVAGAALGAVSLVATGEGNVYESAVLVAFASVLAVPALVALAPDDRLPSTASWRGGAVVAIAVFTALVAVVSVPVGLTVVGADAMPEGGVSAGDYAVTYAENATSGQQWLVDTGDEATDEPTSVSGVIVASDDRELWTVGLDRRTLAFRGEGNVTVGGVGWRETVRAERTGWEVLGNDTAYAVDLEPGAGGETVRAFTSDGSRASAEVDGRRLEVVPTPEGFEVAVLTDGETVDAVPVPETNESADVGDLTVTAVDGDDGTRLMAESGDTRVRFAERETYR
ncbi:rhomboid family intramembrane serine protease (plasmid) [Halorussus salilacus]|uniref:rhomboid family intramembrane serine protease n=1 Tax=Halorussus salilacus TaxID=2953750 RepID=UPI0020A200FF|nr:rhomboid family intramembrane serine protease [Halorussus salilacus]USZ69989.1 rhomboid family intramembrane serine protease [Halorussus salilacus]